MLAKTTLILFVIYFTAIEGLYERPNYPNYKYQDIITGWTSLIEEPADWDSAERFCQSEDAVFLAWINELTNTMIEIAKGANKAIDILFIGAKARSYRDMKIYCQVFYVNNATTGYADCDLKYPYICYAPAPNVDCDTVEFGQDRIGWPGYNRCSKVKGWLKIHAGPSNHENAVAKCKSEGAQLVNPYIPEFKENAVKLFQANSTVEEPILAVYSGAKVVHPYGVLEKIDGKNVWVNKEKQYCVIFLPNGGLGRTECEAKLAFICYAKNPDLTLLGPQLADPSGLLTAPEGIELPYFSPEDLKTTTIQ